MTTKGVEAVKFEVCRLIKSAAQRGELQGDEPLVVLQTLAAKMISEISDDTNRKDMAKALAKHLKEVQSWQGLSDLVVKPKGNLALELSAHI